MPAAKGHCYHCVETILEMEKIFKKSLPIMEFMYRKMDVLGCRHALISEM